jgi:hypothetical protein
MIIIVNDASILIAIIKIDLSNEFFSIACIFCTIAQDMGS